MSGVSNFNAPLLNIANEYAKVYSGCRKVQVGCVIEHDGVIALGANRAIPDLCKSKQCLRIEKYGEDAKTHRLPGDCRAIHAELDALTFAAMHGIPVKGATIWCTRYPCEACARAIVAAGIRSIHYGRQQEISDETYDILACADIGVVWHQNWTEEDTAR